MRLRILLSYCALLSALTSVAQVKHNTAHARSIPAAVMQRGELVYKKVCIACHMANGAGVPMMNPPVINTSYVSGDKNALIKIVLNGFKEDVEINGKSYSNVMTPHSELKDQEIADVLTYVRNSFGNKASAVSVAQVKLVRAANKKS